MRASRGKRPRSRAGAVIVMVATLATAPPAHAAGLRGLDGWALEHAAGSARPSCGASVAYPSTWNSANDPVPVLEAVSLVAMADGSINGLGRMSTLDSRVKREPPPEACITRSTTMPQFGVAQGGGAPTPEEVRIRAVTISGDVNYWKCFGAGNPQPVACVRVTLTADSERTGPVQSAAMTGGSCTATAPGAGHYEVVGEAGLDASLCFERTITDQDLMKAPSPYGGDVANAITVQDAVELQKFVLGLADLDECPIAEQDTCLASGSLFEGRPARVAADVDGDGRITSLDAALIRRTVVAITCGSPQTIHPQFTRAWRFFCSQKRFLPLGLPDTTYSPIAVLPGDVNGSYSNTARYSKPGLDVTLALPNVQTASREVLVPLELRGDPQEAGGVQARVGFDPAVLRFVGAFGPCWTLTCPDGGVGVIFLSDHPIDPGTVATLQFERVTPDGQPVHSPLTLTNTVVGDDDVPGVDGSFATSQVGLQPRAWSQVKRLYRE